MCPAKTNPGNNAKQFLGISPLSGGKNSSNLRVKFKNNILFVVKRIMKYDYIKVLHCCLNLLAAPHYLKRGQCKKGSKVN